MQVQVSPKPRHFSLADWPRCVVCMLFLWHFLGNTGYSDHVYGCARLHNVWECTTSVQNLHCQPGWHFEKKKTIMLGKLQKYFLSPLYPRQCLNKKAFCTLALSVMTVRAEMASSASCQNPTLCPPFCPTGTHSHTHCSGLQGARLVAEGYCATPCLWTNYMAPFHSFGRVPLRTVFFQFRLRFCSYLILSTIIMSNFKY